MGKSKGGIGSMVGMVGGPMGMAAGAMLGGALDSADAAGKAARASANESERQRGYIIGQAETNQREAMKLAEASPQELAAMDRSMSAAQSSLDREQRLLAAIDPALMEASSQALKLMRGEQADVNKPLNDQRNNQRQQLVNSLRAQYGPGAESSSIGQRALQQFDMQSNSMFAQNQQSSLNQMFGMASQDFGGRMSRGIGDMMGVGQGYSHLQERLLNTQMQTGQSKLSALTGTQQQMIQAAGAPYVRDAMTGQAISNFGSNILNAGVSLAGGYMKSMAGGGAGAAGGGGGAASYGGSSGGYQLSNPGTTNANFWGSNPYGN